MHCQYAEWRVNEGREFFAVDPRKAASLLEHQLHEQMLVFIDEFMPDHIIVHSDLALNVGVVDGLAFEVDANPVEIFTSLNCITAEDVRPILLRWKAKVART